MPNLTLQNQAEILRAYNVNERTLWIRNFRTAVILAVVFMPAGCSLDWFVYNGMFWSFFELRLICSALLLSIWWLVATPVGEKYYRVLGWIAPALPTFCISVMIYKTTGAESPYYAGLNLVLLGAAIILRWTFLDSLIVFFEVLVVYLAACLLHNSTHPYDIFFNNIYFLTVTGVFVVIGSHFYNKLRFREFAFRYELDRNRNVLQEINQKLSAQNLALAKANQETRAAEMQLVQSEKLASLGRFSAGLMHDVLNPLNYAKTGTFTLRKKCRNLPPEIKGEFEAILADVDDGLKRVGNIVSDLRTFTHPGGQAAEDVDVAEVLATALKYVGSELNEKNIRVETEVAMGQKAWISRNHLILVLINVMSNAIDALESKKFPEGETPLLHITGHAENGRSFLRLRDNGPGIDPQHLTKVFDPFYTTKDVGKGTGLGLSICFGIVQGYSGEITVASELGKFCEFTLELPCGRDNVTQTENAEPIRL